MSTKKISVGDTLTVGDLTDDHLGAFIEVGPMDGFTMRLQVQDVTERILGGAYVAHSTPVKIITPPPVVQPDEPTILGQCIRIEGDDDLQAVVADPGSDMSIVNHEAIWCSWEEVLDSAGDRQIIVSDPPRWPDETPVVPERIEVGEWPDDDMHLRAWKWIEIGDGWPWWWDAEAGSWRSEYMGLDSRRPLCGPWTRGERVTKMQED